MTTPAPAPVYGEFVYVRHIVGNPYGVAGQTTGVEYDVDIENLIEGGYMVLAPGSVSDPYTVPLGSYGTDPLNPAPGEWVYVYNTVGTPYGMAGTIVGVEYTTHIHRLVGDGSMSLTLPPTSELQQAPLYGDNSFASLGMVKDLMYAYYGGYDGSDGDYSHLILSQRLRDAIVEQMTVTYDPQVQALIDEARDYNADTKDARDATIGYRNTAGTHATTATTKAGEASASASAALTSRNEALSYRNTSTTEANRSKTEADRSKTEADRSDTRATASATSATQAQGFRDTASTHAGTAGTQAGIATTKAGEASTSAANALSYRNTANTAASAAEAARDVALANSLTWRGPWAAGTSYLARDAVSYNGSSWRALAPSTGVTPVEGASWTILAAKGDAGGAAWGDLTGKPSTFPPTIGTTSTTAKAGNYQPTWSEVTSKPATYPPVIGSGAADAVAGNDPRLTDARTPTAHTHPVTDLTATGTRSSSTYLRGDGSWQTPPNSQYDMLTTSEIQAGTDYAAKLISAERLKGAIQRWATGTYSTAISAIGQALNRAATAADARSAIGAVADNDARLSDARTPTSHTHPVGDVNATGTASSSTYLRGDGTWATPTDTNTTYTVPTQAEAEAGTATTARAFSAQRVRQAADAAISAREWVGTQAQYNAIGTKNPNITYYIVD